MIGDTLIFSKTSFQHLLPIMQWLLAPYDGKEYQGFQYVYMDPSKEQAVCRSKGRMHISDNEFFSLPELEGFWKPSQVNKTMIVLERMDLGAGEQQELVRFYESQKFADRVSKAPGNITFSLTDSFTRGAHKALFTQELSYFVGHMNKKMPAGHFVNIDYIKDAMIGQDGPFWITIAKEVMIIKAKQIVAFLGYVVPTSLDSEYYQEEILHLAICSYQGQITEVLHDSLQDIRVVTVSEKARNKDSKPQEFCYRTNESKIRKGFTPPEQASAVFRQVHIEDLPQACEPDNVNQIFKLRQQQGDIDE